MHQTITFWVDEVNSEVEARKVMDGDEVHHYVIEFSPYSPVSDVPSLVLEIEPELYKTLKRKLLEAK